MFLKVSRVINGHVVQLLIAVILFSIAFGYYYPDIGLRLQPFAPICLFLMLVPMMICISLGELSTAAKRIKLISLALLINFLLSPLLAGLLAYYFLSGYPDFAVGLILLGTVPCAGMIVAWTGMSRGNVSVTIVIMVLSYLVGIFLIPFWMLLLAGQYVNISTLGMLKSVFVIIAVPLAIGNILRIQLTKRLGTEKFEEMKTALPAVSTLSMYLLFFISISGGAQQLVLHPEYLWWMILPSLVFYPTLFIAAAAVCWFSGLSYEDLAAISFSVAGKNIAITLALATLFFSPKTVMVVAIMPMVQVTYMATFYKLSPIIQRHWPNKTARDSVKA